MIFTFTLLILGFFLLVKGSDVFVDGSSSLARLLKIPAVVIGLTIVSMGTSAPEAAVSITAGINGSNEIAISNVVGSNTFNMLCVAGMSAVITPFCVDKIVLKRDFPVCIGIMVVTILLSIDRHISLIDGIILFTIFAVYTSYLIITSTKNPSNDMNDEKSMSPVKSVIFIIAGLAAIIAGGQLVVNSAQIIAKHFGMSETLIGVTIVAIGTSLPELVTSVVAAKKGQSGIAIGNVIGSNGFNLAFILGLSSMLNPIEVGAEAIIDAVIMLGANLLGFAFCLTRKKLSRKEAIVLLSVYTAYTVYLVLR